jgi:hypothetical protein
MITAALLAADSVIIAPAQRASGHVSGIPAASATRKLLDRPSHGEAHEPAAKSLSEEQPKTVAVNLNC